MLETIPKNSPRKKLEMFENPFSFDGRINIIEYALSLLIFIFITVVWVLLTADVALAKVGVSPETILSFAISWFSLAQGIKRCYDRKKKWIEAVYPFLPFVVHGEGR